MKLKMSNLFGKEKVEDSPRANESEETVLVNLTELGKSESVNNSGNDIVFHTKLEHHYSIFEETCRKDEMLQKELKKPIEEKVKKLESEIRKIETTINICEQKRISNKDKIQNCLKRIKTVKTNPEEEGLDTTRSKATFYIGLLILLAISAFLTVFYISASYSAFYKEWESTGVDFKGKVMDGHAFIDAWSDSVGAGIFVTFIVFVFMGLGFLVHTLQKGKNNWKWIKIAALIAVTFCFDVLLAYSIEKEVYDLNRTVSSEDFNFLIAFQKPEFWIIIFAGFVTYLIWGLVFDFVMKEWELFNPIRLFIMNEKDEIQQLREDNKTLQNEIDKLKADLTSQSSLLEKEQESLNGWHFPIKKYLHRHHAYTTGWMEGIQHGLAWPQEKKSPLLEKCKMVSDTLLKSKGFVNNIDNNDENE